MKRSLPFGGLVAPTVGSEWQSAFSPFKLRGMKIRQSGFTLIEVLIVVAIAAILLSLAAPTFREMLVKRSVQAAAETLASDMRFARSEALKRSTRTVICRSTDGSSCATALGSWSDGWLVFVDSNVTAAGTAIPGEDLVRVQQALPNIASMMSINPAGTLLSYRFEPTGVSASAFSNFVVTPTGTVPAGSTRLLCISRSGRPALRVEGSTAC
jgi:type IV fimbrial biogenesis protein FimT